MTYNKAQLDSNPQLRAEYNQKQREYLKANPDKLKIYNKRAREKLKADPEKYAKHREKCNEYARNKNREVREECLQAYGGVCSCCSEARYEFLSIDHINGGGTKHRKEVAGTKQAHYLRKLGYPSGYRILCHNCNQSLGFYGYCPHQEM